MVAQRSHLNNHQRLLLREVRLLDLTIKLDDEPLGPRLERVERLFADFARSVREVARSREGQHDAVPTRSEA